MHPGDTQETPRRHPGDAQETSRGHLENYEFLLLFAANLANGRTKIADIHSKYDILDDCSLISAVVKCRDPHIWCESDKDDPHQVRNIAAKVSSATRPMITMHHVFVRTFEE